MRVFKKILSFIFFVLLLVGVYYFAQNYEKIDKYVTENIENKATEKILGEEANRDEVLKNYFRNAQSNAPVPKSVIRFIQKDISNELEKLIIDMNGEKYVLRPSFMYFKDKHAKLESSIGRQFEIKAFEVNIYKLENGELKSVLTRPEERLCLSFVKLVVKDRNFEFVEPEIYKSILDCCNMLYFKIQHKNNPDILNRFICDYHYEDDKYLINHVRPECLSRSETKRIKVRKAIVNNTIQVTVSDINVNE